MSTMTVIAFDPGGTTGWASYQATKILNDEGVAEYYDIKWNFGTLGPDRHHQQLTDLLELSETDIYHVVCESFDDRPEKQSATEMISRDYIGVISLWGQQSKHPIHMQTASMAKGFVTDKKLKVMDLWSLSKHSRDATRHLILYMVTNLQMTWLVHPWKELT
jgi:hypothetical protein